MTAGMGQARKRSEPRTLRRRLVCTLAAVGVWTVGIAGMAPAAVAADVQSKQWYLEAMGAEDIWKSATGEGIKVAVIDSGVNSSTPSLKGQVLKGLDATEADGEATDDYNGHGTTMAELIAGTGRGGGLRGLAPGAKIVPMRIADVAFAKAHKVNAWAAADAIRAAADSDAQIISMSFGSELANMREVEAVKYAESKGKLFFASAGNNAEKGNKLEYPASYPQVVGVAAIDRNGRVGDYSQHGESVDIAAPGNDIPGWCDENFKSYCNQNGTSAAAAIASASAALIWSAHPDWTANQVLRVMFDSAARPEGSKKGTLSNYLGHGVVRPGAHINRGLGKPGDPNLSPLTNKKTTASPAPSAPPSSQAPKGGSESDAVVTGSSKSTDDGGQLGLIIGIGAAVVIAVGVFAVIRKRRSA
ncbi:S8 family serine peptidase [Streptomyces lunaelactis]|uniref:S8 family serine peptidase n=1 Tax=Streptomyces lunaelactis TaxID=1535768 RepID=UPI001584DF28|nr:S8 family serine peptidase [Streptomyces lunaelactis]NUK12071.1 S8 family serine peptidase [Streptomyces lunaelactis]NUK26496.1 S8 family serine peptidase [Streptomyces lunaelactis]NUK60978.1 S8 family serine peptidase [Streptomyces lunaelactis]NUK73457.1 S8 family serine peptidase [Streptomyces lunaelactis]NUK75827.1 S8 family serine peptidase [Streptomyces lunaelactis]